MKKYNKKHSQWAFLDAPRRWFTLDTKPTSLETFPSLYYNRSLEHLDYNTKVVLIPLIVSAGENTPRSWALRDLELTWSTLRQPQQPVPGGRQRDRHKADTAGVKGGFHLLPAAHGDCSPPMTCAQAWSHCANPLPTKIFLDGFIWINLNFIAHKEVNSKQIYQTAEPDLHFTTNPVQSVSLFYHCATKLCATSDRLRTASGAFSGSCWSAFLSFGSFMWD